MDSLWSQSSLFFFLTPRFRFLQELLEDLRLEPLSSSANGRSITLRLFWALRLRLMTLEATLDPSPSARLLDLRVARLSPHCVLYICTAMCCEKLVFEEPFLPPLFSNESSNRRTSIDRSGCVWFWSSQPISFFRSFAAMDPRFPLIASWEPRVHQFCTHVLRAESELVSSHAFRLFLCLMLF